MTRGTRHRFVVVASFFSCIACKEVLAYRYYLVLE